MFFNRLDRIIESLPPYSAKGIKHNRLFELLNEGFFDNEPNIVDDGCYHRPDHNDHFHTDLTFSDLDSDLGEAAVEFNRRMKAMIAEYRVFIEDCIRVREVYADFLENIHAGREYLNARETADIYRYFLSKQDGRINTYARLEPSGTMSETFVPLNLDGDLVMYEKYRFSTVGGFLYIDLFKGLQNHYLPRKCGLCGLYYLLEATAYSPFCTRPVKGRRGKTCRDLGHRKTYTDKVNSDPILLTYTKAYKQHYARYLKKKMTQAEFREWADFALELRQRAYDKELSFEEYETEIRK
ncbi:hypothetical protein SAMN02910447_02269 [Ruminococcus sp. YE71]|uniref:DUF6076 domain-containing protein n=1 Tax=unclassified Ruminococcus TaxID=2608920 RepID=UPI000882EA23|nr:MULTISPECIES: DUF6076 domain-containing protein [unclassified Ruminococcus]SDA23038.1 hypothetical protein SAMN02910446_02137 [Ruminococcus sp. YE78]SFW39177.1 hypothetical protein SAMN02910447_02269 [Ruminococcus sp. YE71]